MKISLIIFYYTNTITQYCTREITKEIMSQRAHKMCDQILPFVVLSRRVAETYSTIEHLIRNKPITDTDLNVELDEPNTPDTPDSVCFIDVHAHACEERIMRALRMSFM